MKKPTSPLHRRTEFIVPVIAACYTVAVFGFFLGRWLSETTAFNISFWGQFGDYVGGLLNPAVAFAALILLAKTIDLQKSELDANRAVLQKQADAARDTAQLSALSSLIDSIMAEVQVHRQHLTFIVDQLSQQQRRQVELNRSAVPGSKFDMDQIFPMYALDGTFLTRASALSMLTEINDRIVQRMIERNKYESEVAMIMLETRRLDGRVLA